MERSRQMNSKEWSIVIPALNEEKHISLCLESVSNLNCCKNSIEIIVVDNGSTDRTAAIAAHYTTDIDKKVLIIPHVTVGALRNAGAEVSSGRFLAFLDADCTVARSWLALATRLLSENPSSIAGAFYDVPEDAGWPARLWHRYLHPPRAGEVTYIPASNLLIEKSLFRQIGGFNAGLRTNEDSQLCAKARLAGSKVLAFPELTITHLGAERTLLDFAKRQLWHGSSVLNRDALRSNARAIGIGVYTWTCICWLIIRILGAWRVLNQ